MTAPSPPTIEFRIKMTEEEFARLTRVAEAHGMDRLAVLQHLVILAEECLDEQQKRRAAKLVTVAG